MLGLRLTTLSLAALFLLGAAVALSAWLYATRYSALARRRTALLLSIRGLTLLALLFASLGPIVAYALASRAQNRLLVLVDRSGSMSVRDERGGRASRADAADSAALSIASTLGGRYDVRLAAFDASLGPFRRPSEWRSERAGGPPGGETALGDALREVAERVDPDSVAAILVLSDGTVNRGEAPEQAPTNGLPVYALTVGAASDPPTVGIAGIEAPGDVIVDRAAAIELTVHQGARGATSGKARVLEGGRELGNGSYSLPGAGASARVTIPFTLGAPGKHFLSVALDSVAGDPMRENKRLLVAVSARPPKRLFLLLASRWDWDLRSLARGVEEDSSWSVVWLRPSGADGAAAPGGAGKPLAALLETADAVAARYDARVMTPARGAALLRYVERGGGALLWVDPELPPPTNLPLATSLGLMWGSFSDAASGATVDLAPAGRGHELSLLGGDAATASAQWKSLPPVTVPFYLGTRSGSLEPLLLARMGGGSTPLLLAGRCGAGRVSVLDAAGVYRWGLTAAGLTSGPGIESAFFGGLRRWLALSREERPVRVSAPDITPEGRPVPVRVTLANTPEAGLAARITARPLGAPGRIGEAVLGSAPEGGYTGSVALLPGVYELLARVERGGRSVGSDSTRVAVGSQGIEYESLAADPGTLARLAAATGGAAAPLDAPAPVLDRLRSPDSARVRRAEVNLVQNPILFLVIVLGAALEWSLRRRFHLL
jgi:hypothetical protein